MVSPVHAVACVRQPIIDANLTHGQLSESAVRDEFDSRMTFEHLQEIAALSGIWEVKWISSVGNPKGQRFVCN